MKDKSGIEALRRRYAERVVRAADADDSALIDAFATVPREDFVGPPPWLLLGGAAGGRTRSDDPGLLYQDVLVSLAPERGINNGQPSLHARCLAACAPAAGETVIHVGAGTGYYSAILATLVGPQGRVRAYEIEADLAQRARGALRGWPNVEVIAASATEGVLPAADVVYVSAGATHPAPNWLDALAPGGRLVFPLTPGEVYGCMLLVTRRSAERFAAHALCRVSFIPCVGACDETEAAALSETLRTRNLATVHSLHRGSAADDTAWHVGTGWWLSKAEA